MATPSSSVTSASPPATCLHSASPSLSTDIDPLEREERERAIQKFMARAEISLVSDQFPAAATRRRGLPSLALGLPSAALVDPSFVLAIVDISSPRFERLAVIALFALELTPFRLQVVRDLRTRLSYASYKAIHNIPHVPLNDLEARTRALVVAPPRLIGTKRKASGGNSGFNNAQGAATRRPTNAPFSAAAVPISHSQHPSDVSGTAANGTQSLYTALLGPPPLKQARMVHNPGAPPVSPASRSSAGSRPRQARRGAKSSSAARSIAEGTRAQSRSRKEEAKRARSQRVDKGKQRVAVEQTADVERQAVATLTSLLHSRPSVASLSSPRSSLSAMSDLGSSQLFSHHGHGSTGLMSAVPHLLPSADSSLAMPSGTRVATPPRNNVADLHSTPRADDEEAANLMLYLHTSPSPARPTTTRERNARDLAAFRTLGGGGSVRAKGRVLFPGVDDSKSPLRSESSFTVDTFSASQGSQLSHLDISNDSGRTIPPLEPTIIPPTPESRTPPQSQLLPPPSSPRGAESASSVPPQAPPTPGNMPFNLDDFINVSPSPAATVVPRSTISLRSGLGANLRTDLGRRLFEEEQHRHGQLALAPAPGDSLRNGSGAGVLGAGIDLETR